MKAGALGDARGELGVAVEAELRRQPLLLLVALARTSRAPRAPRAARASGPGEKNCARAAERRGRARRRPRCDGRRAPRRHDHSHRKPTRRLTQTCMPMSASSTMASTTCSDRQADIRRLKWRWNCNLVRRRRSSCTCVAEAAVGGSLEEQAPAVPQPAPDAQRLDRHVEEQPGQRARERRAVRGERRSTCRSGAIARRRRTAATPAGICAGQRRRAARRAGRPRPHPRDRRAPSRRSSGRRARSPRRPRPRRRCWSRAGCPTGTRCETGSRAGS